MRAVILDIDGTLVDTNYHHALAWYRAFRQHDLVLPIWRIHRSIGMGGDQLIAELAGDQTEEEKGDEIRAAEKPLYMAMIEEVEPFTGARELISELHQRGHTVVLASSAKSDEVDHYVEQLGAADLVDGWTTSADVEQTKPEPDLVEAALEKADTRDGVLVGDSVWDCEAAKRAGIPSLGVLTGGYSAEELSEAGASKVFESIEELRGDLGAIDAA